MFIFLKMVDDTMFGCGIAMADGAFVTTLAGMITPCPDVRILMLITMAASASDVMGYCMRP